MSLGATGRPVLFRAPSAFALAAGMAVLALGSSTALAQQKAAPSAGQQRQQQELQRPRDDVIADLRHRLDEREAVIADLLRRVQELERHVAGGSTPTSGVEERPRPVAPALEPRTAAPRVAAGPEARGKAAVARAPGTFEVDPEAVDRALERSLVQTGALLLPVGAVELEPRVSYIRQENDAPVFVNQDGLQILASDEVRRDDVEAGLTLRVGLPLDSQFTLDLPYSYERESTATRARFAGLRERTESATGLDDVSLTFTKTLLRESGLLPSLFGAVTWDTDTGDEEGEQILGSGFNELGASLTATKRIDPLVYVGSLSYQYAFEDNDVQPGDQVGASLGAVLAVSPESALRFFVDQDFSSEAEVNGGDVPGSDQVASSLRIGLSSTFTPRVLLDVEASVGITEDAPDYGLRVSLPVRFDLQFR